MESDFLQSFYACQEVCCCGIAVFDGTQYKNLDFLRPPPNFKTSSKSLLRMTQWVALVLEFCAVHHLVGY